MALARDENGKVMQVPGWGAAQSVAIGAASTQSAAVNNTGVRLAPTADCHVAVGVNPSATTASTLMFGASVEFVAISPGDKVAVLQSGSATGSLSVTGVG